MYVDFLHWNNNSPMFIHFFTTGPVPGYHEITEITFFPIDGNFELLDDPSIIPLTLNIKPNHPERSEKYANFKKEEDLFSSNYGYNPVPGEPYEIAIDLFNYWIDKFPFKKSKAGTKEKKIIPYVYDAATLPFLMYFFGLETYNALFELKQRCLISTADFINDSAANRFAKTIYYKVKPLMLASGSGIRQEIRPKNTLDHCILFAKIYKEMIGKMLI